MTTVSDLLRDAARVMSERGMCKGQMHDGENLCALGAVGEVAKQSNETYGALTPALEALKDRVPPIPTDVDGGPVSGLHPVAYWNDLPETTQQDVEKLFLTTADAIEFGGEQ